MIACPGYGPVPPHRATRRSRFIARRVPGWPPVAELRRRAPVASALATDQSSTVVASSLSRAGPGSVLALNLGPARFIALEPPIPTQFGDGRRGCDDRTY